MDQTVEKVLEGLGQSNLHYNQTFFSVFLRRQLFWSFTFYLQCSWKSFSYWCAEFRQYSITIVIMAIFIVTKMALRFFGTNGTTLKSKRKINIVKLSSSSHQEPWKFSQLWCWLELSLTHRPNYSHNHLDGACYHLLLSKRRPNILYADSFTNFRQLQPNWCSAVDTVSLQLLLSIHRLLSSFLAGICWLGTWYAPGTVSKSGIYFSLDGSPFLLHS